MATAELTVGSKCHPFRFHGSGGEFFRIWIVNVFLSILTVGIYSAWAKVRTQRYFYGNTVVDGHSFAYLADPVKILKGRIIAVGALSIYLLLINLYPKLGLLVLGVLLLLSPAIMVAAMSFTARNSAYRNICFHFERNYRGAYGMLGRPLLLVLLVTWLLYILVSGTDFVALMEQQDPNFHREDLMFSLFFLVIMPVAPWLDYLRCCFIVENAGWGNERFRFSGRVWPFYLMHLAFAGNLMLALIFVSVCSGIYMATTMEDPANPDQAGMLKMVYALLAVFYGAFIALMGYLRARRTNLVFNNSTLGKTHFISRLGARRTAWIYVSNTLAIVATLGLFIPWARVRMARYVAACTELDASGLDDVTAVPESERSAVGDELTEAFDLDFGF